MKSERPNHAALDFRQLFEAVPGLYMVLGPDLVLVAVSDAYLRATMTDRDAILGRHVFEVFPDNPDDPSASGVGNLGTSLQRVLRERVADTMAVQKYDVRRPASEGGGFEERYWSCLNSPVLGDDGEVQVIIHRAEDVTELIHLRERGQQAGELAEGLRSRTLQLEADIVSRAQEVQAAHRQLEATHAQLGGLYSRLMEMDRLKTEFFSNVSHELRTPLALILGPAQRLLGDALPAEQRRAVEMMERNARTLLRRVDDLLDVARLDDGKVEVSYESLDLARLVRRVVANFETVAIDRGIELIAETPPTMVAQVDREKIERILLNLLSNAFKFTPSGGIVRCRVAEAEGSPGAVEIAVYDSGPGIPAELREAVFERFRQVDGGTTRRVGGTGLGLAIVKELVELHGGTVVAGVAPEGGAGFTVEIPLVAPDGVVVSLAPPSSDDEPAWAPDAAALSLAELRLEPAAQVPSEPVEAATSPIGSGAASEDAERALVLVVEDNPDMRAFIAESLATRYRVVTAPDGQVGLETAIRLRPDLILSDIMMPRVGGEQLLAEVRRQPDLANVPFILLTARADDGLRVSLLRQGAQDYLLKPFAADELAARVGNLIAIKRVRDELQGELASRNVDIEQLARAARQAIRARDDFLSVAAHELKTPLTSLLASSQLVVRFAGVGGAPDVPRVQHVAAIVQRQAGRMSRLVENLLDIARLRTDRLVLTRTATDLSALAEEVAATLQAMTDRHEIVVRADGPVIAPIDAGRFEQVITNLVDNAIRHSPGGLVEVEVLAPSSDTVHVAVTDQGDGIPAEHRDRLFERFYRAHVGGQTSGLGLGLYISRQIVELHGGRLELAESREAECGARFLVSLPRR